MPEPNDPVDIAIIGAGPVGMALAIALSSGPYRLLLIDSRARGAWTRDPRALALSHGSRQLLETLGAWCGEDATAIETIHVSQRGGFGCTVIDRRDHDLPALGYVMRYRDLAATLDSRLGERCRLDRHTLAALQTTGQGIALRLASGHQTREVNARLVVHAEGTPTVLDGVKVRDYHQHAVVAEVQPRTGHLHRAWERFTPDGPLALLPLAQAYSLVFTVPSTRADPLLGLDDSLFLATLRQQFGNRLDFVACGPRAAFPLALRLRQRITGPRQVWLGNAAQSLHPVSGQGFNVGLRDAWELADALLRNVSSDAGDAATLATYARRRFLDRHGSAAFTDGIVRIFSNDWAPLRVARGLGLQALDLLPPLRHYLARRMIWGARAWP
mgnify:CR=1 FL=1